MQRRERCTCKCRGCRQRIGTSNVTSKEDINGDISEREVSEEQKGSNTEIEEIGKIEPVNGKNGKKNITTPRAIMDVMRTGGRERTRIGVKKIRKC